MFGKTESSIGEAINNMATVTRLAYADFHSG